MLDTIFRLFISSTFADFQHERRALHERVLPLLDAHCRSRGARFETVDLRWGISREAQEDNRTLAICLAEVERCRRIGPPPNFVVLLGDRYGWEPPPAEIAGVDWLRIATAAGPDINLLDRYYTHDTNSVPVAWRIRPDMLRDASAGEIASLVAALRRAALEAGLAPAHNPAIFFSATHQEIVRGLFTLPPGSADVFAYMRTIDGLPFAPHGAPFVDTHGDRWNEVAHQRLQNVKEEVAGHLAPGHMRHITTRWNGSDIDTGHIDDFCEQFLADQIWLIDRSLGAVRSTSRSVSGQDRHTAFAQERARLFVGRAEELAHIADYVSANDREAEKTRNSSPLVFVGSGGTGKSALLAQGARLAASTNEDAVVLSRFIGAVPGSSDLALLLGDLAHAVLIAYDRDVGGPSAEFDAASAAFGRSLECAVPARPLVIFIDALDQLPVADQLRLLDWMPQTLPVAVRIIMTTREGRLADEARRRFPQGVIHLESMDVGDSKAMLDALLADAGRRISERQRALVEHASPGLPLWTRLVFEEARHWRSDDPGRRLEGSIEGLVHARIENLSAPIAHGSALVGDALGALAASRFGLSDAELAEALSQEHAPDVWAEFRQRSFHHWDERELPPILWFRLHADLAPYLSEQRVDGAIVYRFFHREFEEVVARRFLHNEHGIAMHRRLAKVFAAPDSDGLHVSCDVTRVQSSHALRRIMEQPWQLAAAQADCELAALTSDIGFVAAKCAANRVPDLMRDLAALRNERTRSGTAQEAGSWRARLLAWRAILAQADMNWPAHRILFQLLIESDDELPQRSAAMALLQRFPPDWPILASVSRQRYIDPPLATVPAMPRMSGMAPLSPRIIAAWDENGSLRLTDRMTGELVERVELGSVERVAGVLERLASALPGGSLEAAEGSKTTDSAIGRSPANGTAIPVFSVPDRRDRRRPVEHETDEPHIRLSWQWGGCLIVAHDAQRIEIIIGKEDILFLGETERELFFLADERIAVAEKQHLAELKSGLFSFNGQHIDGIAIDGNDGGWTHERFNSIVFIDADTCLTFGFSLGGAQRDDVILEIYRIGDEGVARRAYGITDHDLDLPIWHIVGLTDGSVVFASERYWHTFVWAPPFHGECDVTMIPGAAAGNGELGNWVNTGNEDGHLSFVPRDPSLQVSFDAPGFFGSIGGEYHAPDGIWRLDADDFPCAPYNFAGIEVETAGGNVARWCTDVQPHWIFDRGGLDYIVFKNSGPVRVAQWHGQAAADKSGE